MRTQKKVANLLCFALFYVAFLDDESRICPLEQGAFPQDSIGVPNDTGRRTTLVHLSLLSNCSYVDPVAE